VSFRTTLDKEVAAGLNEQIKHEASPAVIYFSLASWASVRGLTGMADWFRAEAQGELAHTSQVVDYLNDRDCQARFATIEAPAYDWANPVEAFEMIRSQEHTLPRRFNHLIGMAVKYNDQGARSFVHQFAPQQIHDTAEADDLHDRLQLVGGDGHGLILVDQELGRKAAAGA